MATRKRPIRGLLESGNGATRLLEPAGTGMSLRDLVGRLGHESGELIRNEISLAKLELRESAQGYARDSIGIGIGVALGAAGALALVAAMILLLGMLIGAYWASALIVAVVLIAAGAFTARSALARMRRRDVAPKETIESLRADRDFVAAEARELKQDLKGGAA